MISVQLDCEDMECFANEYVDVYMNDFAAGARLDGYVPEGWQIIQADNGLALALCPNHARHQNENRR